MCGRSKAAVRNGGCGAGLNPPEWEQPRKIPAEKQGKVGSIVVCTGQVFRWWMHSPEMLVRFQPDLILCATSPGILDTLHTLIPTPPPFAAPHLETGGVFAFLDKYNTYGIMGIS